MSIDWARVLIGGALSAISASALAWAFKWTDRQRLVVMFIMAFFIQGLLILVTQKGVK